MKNTTTPSTVATAMADYFLPRLLECEDFDAFEKILAKDTRLLAASCMRDCIEAFDAGLAQSPPRGWTVRGRAERTLVTLLGRVTYKRTIFTDRAGCRRCLADELLGVPKRSRLSSGAFLWVAYHAAELSYRKTASEFRRVSGEAISHVTVMNVVHREGALLKSAGRGAERVSCPELFLEVDGMYVHLQKERHLERALPRGIYEQARKTRSFELKMACLYAGKARAQNGRVRRVNLDVTCADADADGFWEAVWDMICSDYDERDIERVNVGSDGGGWCGPGALSELMSAGVELPHFLDMFHVMQAICRAFPEGQARDKAQQLAFRGRASTLARGCRLAAKSVVDRRRRGRVNELARYLENNAGSIRARRPSMGTMEGTNGRVGAARLKGNGRSWSRRGAEAMCLIRCAIAVGRPLVAPPKDARLTEREKAAEDRRLATFTGSSVPESAGAGYEPRFQVQTWSLPSALRFEARTGILR